MAELIKATKISQKPIKCWNHRAYVTNHEAAQAGKHKQIPSNSLTVSINSSVTTNFFSVLVSLFNINTKFIIHYFRAGGVGVLMLEATVCFMFLDIGKWLASKSDMIKNWQKMFLYFALVNYYFIEYCGIARVYQAAHNTNLIPSHSGWVITFGISILSRSWSRSHFLVKHAVK